MKEKEAKRAMKIAKQMGYNDDTIDLLMTAVKSTSKALRAMREARAIKQSDINVLSAFPKTLKFVENNTTRKHMPHYRGYLRMSLGL